MITQMGKERRARALISGLPQVADRWGFPYDEAIPGRRHQAGRGHNHQGGSAWRQ
jgi:hypothetical protein